VRRARIPLLLLAPLALLCARPVWSQKSDLEKIFEDQSLESLIDTALQLNITAKVLPPDRKPTWNSESKSLTIPGRSVAVRLVGDNIRVEVVFTPYQEEGGNLLLVAQGQVWVSDVAAKGTRYVTTFQSIPVSWGEKVLFFPLGLSDELSGKKTFSIQLEVELKPYKELIRPGLE
jgi:hypothetical protein